ncbi:EscC/YscC/HrcC family type III secretion system outer membrane ring protein [Dyella flava]|nr:EscC/YscC/HrcC family type III secretion system outer membrane ring protein [Dyella flava]
MVVYNAKGRPLAQVLKEILATQPFPVVIKSDVRGEVNGQFEKSARAVFSELEAAYGFTWYFDGSTMYIASSADNMSEVVGIAPLGGTQAMRTLADLGLIEPRFNLRVSGGSVLVSGPSRYVELVVKALDSERERASLALSQRSMSLVGSLAKPPPGGTQMEIRVFPLRYAQAQDSRRVLRDGDAANNYVVPGVATLLRNLLKGAYATTQPDKDDLLKGVAAGSALASLPSVSGGEGDGNDLRTQALLAIVAGQRRGNPQEGQVDRDVHIQADVRTNSVVIFDTPAMMPLYAPLIEQLDRPQALVQLDVAIIDIDSSDVHDLGVDLSVRGDKAGMSSGSDGLNFQAMNGLDMNRLNARIAMLETKGRARVLSRPKIMTLNNTQATMGNEQTFYVKTSGDRYASLTPISSGLSFRATPLVIPVDGAPAKIKLELEIDDGGFTQLNVDDIPGSSHKYLATEAVVEDGQSLLVGGFQYENVGSSMSGVPGLSQVPGVGALFRRTQKSHQQIERLFLITPRVIDDYLNDTSLMQAVLPSSSVPLAKPHGANRAARMDDDNPQFLNVWSASRRSIDMAPPNILPTKPLAPVPNPAGVEDKRNEVNESGAKKPPSIKVGDAKKEVKRDASTSRKAHAGAPAPSTVIPSNTTDSATR